jgi:MSHA biogenesis protein MshL
MLRLTLAAVLLLGQEMPVVRLTGTQPGRGSQTTVEQSASSPSPGAPGPQQLRPLPVTETDATAAAALDSARHLTLMFAEPRPVDDVLRLLVAGTPFSLAIDPDATGAFRGELRDLTLRDALTTLLAPLGLDFTLESTVIHITHRRIDTREFDLNVLDIRRSLQRTNEPASSAPSAGGAAVALASTVPADDVLGGIGEGVQALLSEAGHVHIDRRAGLATVADYPERLDRVALYLETLHMNSSREVRLEAQAFEVTLNASASIDWRAVREKLGVPPGTPMAGLGGDPAALRAALAAQGDLRMLWSPEITTLNNEPVLIRLDTPGVATITLTVVPQISSDGIVQLAVSHTWEELAGEHKEGFPKSTPIRRVSEADTVTRLTSGSAMLLSGLIRPVQVSKPATGAAALFGAQPKQDGHAELVVLVRPTIVTAGARD